MIKKIEALNKDIDRLMKEKSRLDGQRETYEKNLLESISKYAEKYGVDLSGKSFADIKSKLSAEIKKVEEQTAMEYERSQKLVSLINSGDIKGAWKELGVDLDEEKTEESHYEELQGVAEAISDVEEEISDDDFFGTSVEDDEELEDGDFFVEDDEEDVKKDEVSSNSVKPVFGGISFDDEDDDFLTPKTVNKEEPEVDDEDEEDGFSSFGGFGGILAGSKFDVNKNRG